MDPIEQRVRESLRARAEDVEPTPHLYRGVQQRIGRRQRLRVAVWSLAGVAAVAVAVMLVPNLVSGLDQRTPEVADTPDQPVTGAASPTRAITVDRDGQLRLLDVTTGATEHEYGTLALAGTWPVVAVAPQDVADVPTALVGGPQDRPDGPTLAITSSSVDRRGSTSTTVFEPEGPGPEVDGRFAVSPDGAWTASLAGPGPDGDADGWALQLRGAPGAGDGDGEDQVVLEPGIVVPAGSVVQDWSGSVAAGATSEVTVITREGRLIGFPLVAGADGSFVWEGETVATLSDNDEVVAYADAHLGDGTGFALVWRAGEDQLLLQVLEDAEVLVERSVAELVGDPDADTVALDAWGDSAVLSSSDGESWLLRSLGDGALAPPVALPAGTVRAALVGRELDSDPVEEPTAVGPLGDGLVVASDTTGLARAARRLAAGAGQLPGRG